MDGDYKVNYHLFYVVLVMFYLNCKNAQIGLPMSGKNICIGRIDIEERTQYT